MDDPFALSPLPKSPADSDDPAAGAGSRIEPKCVRPTGADPSRIPGPGSGGAPLAPLVGGAAARSASNDGDP
ncbi:hypothetical protein P8605_49190 [Streptomyces sp. T-3]|nr:hypothetical protein [Streptomyces sp. T-3]